MKDLVAYFSASGSTAKLAGTLASAAGAELYEIRPAVPYERRDLNWMDKKSRSTLEMQDRSCRPPLADTDAPVAEAERIFLGFPIWWYREPSIVDTFVESNAEALAGKTIVPFATSGGSNIKKACEDLQAAYPNYKFGEGKLLNSIDKADIEKWAAAVK